MTKVVLELYVWTDGDDDTDLAVESVLLRLDEELRRMLNDKIIRDYGLRRDNE